MNTGYDYDELVAAHYARRPVWVSEAAARREVEAHGLDFVDFRAECPGTPQGWDALTVLDWLGY